MTKSPAPTKSSEPGFLAQMAATAGSVAMGSVIGHGLSSMLFGSGSSAAEAQAPEQEQERPYSQQRSAAGSCEQQAKGRDQVFFPPSFFFFVKFGVSRLFEMLGQGRFGGLLLVLGAAQGCTYLLFGLSLLSSQPLTRGHTYSAKQPLPRTSQVLKAKAERVNGYLAARVFCLSEL
jgi:hypothetical protein